MTKRGWIGNTRCQFCNDEETISHMFFSFPAAKIVWSCVAQSIGAPDRPGSYSQFFWWYPQHVLATRNAFIMGIAAICWAIWKLRNKACFLGKINNSPIELISFVVVFMKYWAGLNRQEDQDALRQDANILLEVAMRSQRTHPPARLGIEAGRQDGDAG
jgi:hypothetical protein